MPLCGFNEKMIEGIVVFSDGLFAATLERGKENGVEDVKAVDTETREIDLFIQALKDKYGSPDDAEQSMAGMIYGVAVFAGSLLKATLAAQESSKASLGATFDDQVKKVGSFLEELEKTHQVLKRSNSPEQTMKMAVDWIDKNGHVDFRAKRSRIGVRCA